MHALGAKCRVYQLSSPSVREIAGRSGATLVDLMNTTGLYSLAERPRDPIHASALRAVGGRLLMGPASFLKFTTSARTTSWMMVITC
jgi:ATP-dependent Zn protease